MIGESQVMAFEAKDETVGELLNKVVFTVPRNQRRYVWEKEHWEELLEDILFSCKAGKKAHFLGSIVLKDEGKKEGIARYTIIDGQQRVTTITLILIAIMKLFVERNMQDEFLGTIDYVMTTNNRNQKMPILTSDYHLSLEKIINKIVEFNNSEAITIDAFVNSCILSSVKDKKIGDAIKFFYKSISAELEQEKDNANEKLLEIRDAIIEMVLVSIISSTEEDSYTIFEILNARGQELEQYELLKNYIMRYIEPVENRDSAKEKWEEMERELGPYIKKFINQYAWHKYGIVEGMSTYRIIQKKTKGTNVNELLDDILIKARYYCKFIKPTIGDEGNCLEYEFRIYSFFKSRRQEQFRPLMLSLLHQRELGKLSESLYEQTLKYLYNFFVCYTIIGKEKSNNLRDTIIQYACTLENDYSDEKLLEFGEALKKKIPSYEWFEVSFSNLGWSNHTEIFKNSKDKERVRLTLEILEKFVSQRFDIDEFTIEHILPDSQGEANAHIGNMIPLESRLNGLCKDKKLEEKYDLYEKSNFSTARGIKNRYAGKEFDPSKRTKYLAKLVYNNILELEQIDEKNKKKDV